MKKRKEPMEFPLLEVIVFPGEVVPVSIILPGDFEVSGEVQISMGVTEEQLGECAKLLDHVRNAVADELWLRRNVKEPPFKPTGKVAPKNNPSE